MIVGKEKKYLIITNLILRGVETPGPDWSENLRRNDISRALPTNSAKESLVHYFFICQQRIILLFICLLLCICSFCSLFVYFHFCICSFCSLFAHFYLFIYLFIYVHYLLILFIFISVFVHVLYCYDICVSIKNDRLISNW